MTTGPLVCVNCLDDWEGKWPPSYNEFSKDPCPNCGETKGVPVSNLKPVGLTRMHPQQMLPTLPCGCLAFCVCKVFQKAFE